MRIGISLEALDKPKDWGVGSRNPFIRSGFVRLSVCLFVYPLFYVFNYQSSL